MNRQQLRTKLDTTWADLAAACAGLSDAEMTEPGVAGEWSVKDVLAHVMTWEEECLEYLPVIAEGKPALRYATYGGIDAFNALRTEQKRALSLADLREQMDAVHARLLAYLAGVPEELIVRETRFRHRLRMDTYHHYPQHARMIREWRAARAATAAPVG